MRPRFTPLNFVTSILLVVIAYSNIYQNTKGWQLSENISLLILAVISFVTDLLFRRFLKDLKRIWIIEVVFIIFAVIMILLIQQYYF